MNPAIVFLIGPAIYLTVSLLEAEGSPVHLNGQPKPPNCPYGQCFIDRCTRICSCLPPEGSTICTNNFRSSMECNPPDSTDNCPLGKTYRSPYWTDNFLCFCNNDASQTYACFDLPRNISANAQELLIVTRNNSKTDDIIASDGKRSTESIIQQTLEIH